MQLALNSHQNHASGSARLRKRFALSAAVLLLCAGALEGAARVRQFVKFGTFTQLHQFVLDPSSGLPIPPPGRSTGMISINSRGFRGPEIEVPKPPERLRLAFLGGSTTFCAEASCNETTWPALLAADLAHTFPERSIDYVNAGIGGYRLSRIRANFDTRVAPLEPDVVFIYEATNDLTFDSRQIALRQGLHREGSDAASALSQYSLAWHLIEKNLTLRRRQQQALSPEGRLSVTMEELSQQFRCQLEGLIDEAKSRAKLVVVMTFATHARREQSPEELLAASKTSLYYMPYMSPQLLLDAFDEFNQVIRAVAREREVLLIDVAEQVPGDDLHFNDSVHLKDPGCAMVVQAVSRALQNSPEFLELVGRSR